MWKDYSLGFIRKNRASSISVMAAAFISSLFLSFLCSIFYNLWVYDVEKTVFEEGDWQGRLTGEISDEDILTISGFANVERAVRNDELSEGRETAVDLYFYNPRTIFEDMPLITERLGLEKEASSYHLVLLSKYLIHDPQDDSPPLLLTFYLVVLMIVSLSLVLIIHNSFAVSMNARVQQFGIFSSIGATPGQIRTCLMQEAAALCAFPILLGTLLGILLSFVSKEGMEMAAADMVGRYEMNFRYHPAVFLVTVLASALTVLFSAWLPARKLSRMTPLEAIRGIGVLNTRRKLQSPILARLFGLEGELAGNALKAQRKALRTSALSLTLSFLGFTTIFCFFSLSDLSSKYTYTERYQDTWDVMVTVKDTRIEDFSLTTSLAEMEGVQDLAVYQKAEAFVSLPQDTISPELTALGGPKAVAGDTVSGSEGVWQIKAPIVVLDDLAFTAYCKQIGVSPRLDGTIVLNRFWDSLNSVFRYREYVPFIKEDGTPIRLHNKDWNADGGGDSSSTAVLPVLAYTQETPVLKEEYEDYSLVQFIPLSLWKKEGQRLDGIEKDIYIRILAGKGVTFTELTDLEQRMQRELSHLYVIESNNRMKDGITNDNIMHGYKLIMGSFCALLAMIGIANVFSYTAGFLRQRRREFARYMSVGMTPAAMRKMFFIEALVIAGRPILITLPFTYLFVEFTAKASYMNPREVWPEIPVAAIALFCLAIVGFVGLAYYIGGRRVLKYSLVDALRDSTV